MRPGIDHAVRREIVWQIDVRAGIVKTELQYLHPRDAQTVAQRINFRSDHAQVFSDEGKIAQTRAESVKQIVLRSLHPAAIHRRGLRGRNLPIALKAAEVIEPDYVTAL